MKIKLRDMTPVQYKKWCETNCATISCVNCVFHYAQCAHGIKASWVLNKDNYSDKFLDQEVEIESNEQPLLTEEEKQYLRNVIKPFKKEVHHIKKTAKSNNLEYVIISFDIEEIDVMYLGVLPKRKIFKEMELDKKYYLEELGI